MVDIIIQGIGGRMGSTLVKLISQRNDCRIVAGIDVMEKTEYPYPVFASLPQCTVDADVLIDFSHPAAVLVSLEECALRGLPCVICTTGLTPEIKQEMVKAAEKTAVFFSANMSIGVNLVAELVRKAAAALQGFDIEIVEKHHRNKLDAPSGTALMLADEINAEAGGKYHYQYNRQPLRQKRPDNEIGISAVRGGSIVGEHDVIFAGQDEVVTISHTAYSRDVFASGAIAAALYVAGKAPGQYDMGGLIQSNEMQ